MTADLKSHLITISNTKTELEKKVDQLEMLKCHLMMEVNKEQSRSRQLEIVISNLNGIKKGLEKDLNDQIGLRMRKDHQVFGLEEKIKELELELDKERKRSEEYKEAIKVNNLKNGAISLSPIQNCCMTSLSRKMCLVLSLNLRRDVFIYFSTTLPTSTDFFIMGVVGFVMSMIS